MSRVMLHHLIITSKKMLAEISSVVHCSCATAILSLVWVCVASAQANEGVFVDIGPCMEQATDALRYACYDQLEETVEPLFTVSDRELIEEEQTIETEAVVESFGRSPTQPPAQIQTNEAGLEEMVDTIASIREGLPNKWVISLSSGQQWRQTIGKRYRLRKGMSVRIFPSPFGGSFRLEGEGLNGFIQVARSN